MIIGYRVKVIEEHLPPRMHDLLNILSKPRTAAEVAALQGRDINHIYRDLAFLQRLDLAEKVGRVIIDDQIRTQFKSTGRPPKVDYPHARIAGVEPEVLCS